MMWRVNTVNLHVVQGSTVCIELLHHSQQKSPKCRMIFARFQGKASNTTVIQVYAPTSNAEVEWFYEDLQDLLELTPKKDVLFIIGDWNAKVGVTGKFGLGVQNESGQRIIEFCQENALVISKHPLPTTQEKTLHMDITRWSTPK